MLLPVGWGRSSHDDAPAIVLRRSERGRPRQRSSARPRKVGTVRGPIFNAECPVMALGWRTVRGPGSSTMGPARLHSGEGTAGRPKAHYTLAHIPHGGIMKTWT